MSTSTLLLVLGRVDQNVNREKLARLLQNGLSYIAQQDASFWDSEAKELVQKLPEPTQTDELGLQVALEWSSARKHILIQFNPTCDQFHACLRSALTQVADVERERPAGTKASSLSGRVYVVYGGQVSAGSGEWLLSDSTKPGYQLISWLNSEQVMLWRPQLENFADFGDKLRVHIITPTAGTNTSWPMEKRSIRSHVGVRFINLELVVESAMSFKESEVPPTTGDTIQHLTSQLISLHPMTSISLNIDGPVMGSALSAQRPLLYVFPGSGAISNALFTLHGFTLLLGGSYGNQPLSNWWRLIRNLPKLDVILFNEWSSANIISQHFLENISQSSSEDRKILGEVLVPSIPSTRDVANELFLYPPTDVKEANYTCWVPASTKLEALPPAMVLYYKLGLGEIKLQPLAFRAGLLLFWKSTSTHSTKETSLSFLLPAHQVVGGCPVLGLTRFVKTLDSVKHMLRTAPVNKPGVNSRMPKPSLTTDPRRPLQKPTTISKVPSAPTPNRPPALNMQRTATKPNDRTTAPERRQVPARNSRPTTNVTTKPALINRPTTAPQTNTSTKNKPSTEKRLNEHSTFVANATKTKAGAPNAPNSKLSPIPSKRPTAPKVNDIKSDAVPQLSPEYSELAAVDPLNSGWSGLDQSMHQQLPSNGTPSVYDQKDKFDNLQHDLPIDSSNTVQAESKITKSGEVLDEMKDQLVVDNDEHVLHEEELPLDNILSQQQHLQDEEHTKNEESLNAFAQQEEGLSNSSSKLQDNVDLVTTPKVLNECKNDMQLSPQSDFDHPNELVSAVDTIKLSTEQQESSNAVHASLTPAPITEGNEEIPSETNVNKFVHLSYDDESDSKIQMAGVEQSTFDSHPTANSETSFGFEASNYEQPSNVTPVFAGDSESLPSHDLFNKNNLTSVELENQVSSTVLPPPSLSNDARTIINPEGTESKSEFNLNLNPQTESTPLPNSPLEFQGDDLSTELNEKTIPQVQTERDLGFTANDQSAIMNTDELMDADVDAKNMEKIVQVSKSKHDPNDDHHTKEQTFDTRDSESSTFIAIEPLLVSKDHLNPADAILATDEQAHLPTVAPLPDTNEPYMDHPTDDLPDVLQHITSTVHSTVIDKPEGLDNFDATSLTEQQDLSKKITNTEHSDGIERVVLPGDSGVMVYDETNPQTESLDVDKNIDEQYPHAAPSGLHAFEPPSSSIEPINDLLSPTDSLDDKTTASVDTFMQHGILSDNDASITPNDIHTVSSNLESSGIIEELSSTIISEESGSLNVQFDFLKSEQSETPAAEASLGKLSDFADTLKRQSSDVSDIGDGGTEYSVTISTTETEHQAPMLHSPSDVTGSQTDTTAIELTHEKSVNSPRSVTSHDEPTETIHSGQSNIFDADSTTTTTTTTGVSEHLMHSNGLIDTDEHTDVNEEESSQLVHSTTVDIGDRQFPTNLFSIPIKTSQEVPKELIDSGSPGSEASIDSVVEVPHATDSGHKGYPVSGTDRLVDDSDQVTSSFTDLMDTKTSEHVKLSDYSLQQAIAGNFVKSSVPFGDHKSNGHDTSDSALFGDDGISKTKLDDNSVTQPAFDSTPEFQNKLIMLNKIQDQPANQLGDEFSPVDPFGHSVSPVNSPVEKPEVRDSNDNLSSGSTFDPIKEWGEPQSLPPPPTATNQQMKPKVPPRPASSNQRARVPENLPPGSPVFVDVFWVPAYLSSVPFSMAVEFLTRVRSRIYILSSSALHPIVGEALIAAKAQWNPSDLSVLLQGNADPNDTTIKILPTDEPYDWVCWLQTPCGRENGETGEIRLKSGGFHVMPAVNLSDISFNNGQVTCRCEGVSLEL